LKLFIHLSAAFQVPAQAGICRGGAQGQRDSCQAGRDLSPHPPGGGCWRPAAHLHRYLACWYWNSMRPAGTASDWPSCTWVCWFKTRRWNRVFWTNSLPCSP